METKRCPYCHKLQRANARLCRGCGHPFAPRPRARGAVRYGTRPSIPSASPHRVGHYAGLHPEDQPYQSSIVTAQHPVEPEPSPMPEPERIILTMARTPAQRVEQRRAYSPRPVRHKIGVRLPARLFSERIITLLLTLSCLFFLLASSILAFVLMGKHASVAMAAVWTTPDIVHLHETFALSGSGFGSHSLMVFTYDTNQLLLDDKGNPLEVHADAQGKFALSILVPAQWRLGAHVIHVTDEAEKLSVSTKMVLQSSAPSPTSRARTVLHSLLSVSYPDGIY